MRRRMGRGARTRASQVEAPHYRERRAAGWVKALKVAAAVGIQAKERR